MPRSGMVALVGAPNAGKSSLLNQMLGTKLSIVTAAAQTTRERVVGIDTRDDVQMVFLDTPGIVDPAYLLHHAMLGIVEQTIADADVIVLLVDGSRGPPALDEQIAAAIRSAAATLLVVINKTDVASGASLGTVERWVKETFPGAPLHQISAQTGMGVDELRQAIAARLPESPFLYPEDEVSTQSLRFFVAELIRETIFELYEEEVPYSSAVTIDEFREEKDPIVIRATIHLERESQKGILIGKKGEAIRRLGIESRQKVESFLDARVYLDLWVKVLPKWRKKAEELRRFGFPVPQQHR